MKKVFTTLALATAVVMTAQAQRTTKVKAVLIAPTPDYTIPCDDSFMVEFVFINEGPEVVLGTDTLFYMTPFTADGRVHLSSHDDLPVAVGDTISHVRNYISVDGIGTEAFKKLQRMGPSGGGDWIFAPFTDGEYILGVQATYGFFNQATAPANALYVDTAAGGYAQFVRATYACESISVDEITKLEKQPLTVYPNPTSTDINFKYNFTSNTNASVKVTDVTGRTVLVQDFGKQTVGERNFSINVATLNTGMYYVELVTDEARAISKFNVTK